MNSWMNAIMSLIQGGGGGYQPPGPPMGSMPPYSTPQGMPAMPSMPGTIGFGGFADAPPQYSPQPQAPAYGSYQQQPGYNSGPAYNYPTGSYCQPQVPLAPAATYGGGGAYPRQPPPPPGQTSYYTPPSAGQQFVGSNGQPYEVVYVGGKPKKKKLLKNAAVGLASGLAGGYLASKVFGGGGWCRPWGGGWGGGWGMGRWGSWSSFSSLIDLSIRITNRRSNRPSTKAHSPFYWRLFSSLLAFNQFMTSDPYQSKAHYCPSVAKHSNTYFDFLLSQMSV
ncbi:hypothetical protein T265_02076 [Opisthorchis viverrini]|uniref:PH domain-containing protein n=1 Tax=Opisthorchis viverrini TaxID=6198 RepID=A0A075A7S4_OPIVI|nr:hypothetical protein T265_02076 [Opisthorchis viverrini]KER31705.1 hypothetical protein T265_02076 [Opisthorchis viverrini]